LDASALAKRYLLEPGTETVLNRCRQAEEVLSSAVCVPEITSIFHRWKREKKLSDDLYHLLKGEFAADIEEAVLVEPGAEVLREAVFCIEKTGLKTLDAIHLASALRIGCDLFLTADVQQRKAAKIMGLPVEEI
jgi:hypothetical protein